MRYLFLATLLLVSYAWAAPKPKLKLVSDPWCPVACAEQQAHPGYMVDIAKAVFEPLGFELEYQIVPFARAEMMVNAGDADGFIGVLRLPKRANWAFPAQAQGISRVCFYTRGNSRWQYTNDASLAELTRLGTIRGYSYGPEIDAKLAVAPTDPIAGINGFSRNLVKLNGQRIDAIVEYELIAQYQMLNTTGDIRNAGCSTGHDELYLAFSPKRSDGVQLAQQLSTGVERLRKSGELKQILQTYGLKDWVSSR